MPICLVYSGLTSHCIDIDRLFHRFVFHSCDGIQGVVPQAAILSRSRSRYINGRLRWCLNLIDGLFTWLIPVIDWSDARLSAMESDGWGKVVSEPRITTLDNQQAMIQQGSQSLLHQVVVHRCSLWTLRWKCQCCLIFTENKYFNGVDIAHNRPDFSNSFRVSQIYQGSHHNVLVGDGDTTKIQVHFILTEPILKSLPIFIKYLFLICSKINPMSWSERMLVFVTPHIITRTTTATAQ